MPQIGNTLIHEVAKFIAAYNYRKEGCDFYDEAKFKDKSGFADLYLPDVDWAIEILHSETDARFNAKKYPVKKKVKIDALDYIKQHLEEEMMGNYGEKEVRGRDFFTERVYILCKLEDHMSKIEVSKAADVTYSHASRVLSEYVEQGIITELKEGRAIRVKLTEKGQQLKEDFLRLLQRMEK